MYVLWLVVTSHTDQIKLNRSTFKSVHLFGIEYRSIH